MTVGCSGHASCAGCARLKKEIYAVGNAAQLLGKPMYERALYRCGANGYTVGTSSAANTWPHAACPKR